MAELVQNMPKIVFLTNLQAKTPLGVGLFLGKYLSIININYITMIVIQTATLPFILIKSVVYIPLSLVVKTRFIFHIFDFELKFLL